MYQFTMHQAHKSGVEITLSKELILPGRRWTTTSNVILRILSAFCDGILWLRMLLPKLYGIRLLLAVYTVQRRTWGAPSRGTLLTFFKEWKQISLLGHDSLQHWFHLYVVKAISSNAVPCSCKKLWNELFKAPNWLQLIMNKVILMVDQGGKVAASLMYSVQGRLKKPREHIRKLDFWVALATILYLIGNQSSRNFKFNRGVTKCSWWFDQK